MPVNIHSNKQDTQFVPFDTPLWCVRNIKEDGGLMVRLLGDGRGNIFEIGVDMICLVTFFSHSKI